LFCRNRKQEGKTDPVWGLVPVEGEGYKERVWEHEYGANTCVHMYVKGKMSPVETIPE
jgi:hypothetical protein